MIDAAYSFELGDGSRWLILAGPGTGSWVGKLAHIMKLKSDEPDLNAGYPRILFFSGDSEKRDLGIDFSGDNRKLRDWKLNNSRVLRVWSHKERPDFICEIGREEKNAFDILKMSTALSIVYAEQQKSGGLPIHAALLRHKEKGVVVAGPPGAGKSTLCRRLHGPWSAVSDDQCLIVRDKSGRYLAHPLPTWSEYACRQSDRRWNVEESVPISSLFFLEKADDGVMLMAKEEAAVAITWASIYLHRLDQWNRTSAEQREIRSQVFSNSCELVKKIPTYILRASLTGRCWEHMEEVLPHGE